MRWQIAPPMRKKVNLAITTLDLFDLAHHLGLEVTYHHGRGKGYYLHHAKRISLRDDLTERQLRSTLAHELGHAVRGDVPTGTIFDARAERAADQFAANLLITEEDYINLESLHDGALDPMAHDLGVTVHLIQVWRRMYERIPQ